jgi:uncharacterized phage protein gp47/JayE
MSYTRPTRSQIASLMEADATVLLGGKNVLRYSFIWVIIQVFATALYMLYGFVAWSFRQIFVSTCDSENLELHGDDFDLPRKAAAYATGTITIGNPNGVTIPKGTIFQRADGIQYLTNAEISTNSASIICTAAGLIGNSINGTPLELYQPIEGVSSSASSSTAITGGVDPETDDAYRSRIQQRKQTTPQGGSKSDYETWALSVPGVYKAWVFTNIEYRGLGTVGVALISPDIDDPIPGPDVVDDVQAVLDLNGPVTAMKTAYAPSALSVVFDISLSPNTTEVQDAVEAALKSLFSREGQPGGTIPLSHINEVISTAVGEIDHVLNAPVASVVATNLQYPIVGSISWSAI